MPPADRRAYNRAYWANLSPERKAEANRRRCEKDKLRRKHNKAWADAKRAYNTKWHREQRARWSDEERLAHNADSLSRFKHRMADPTERARHNAYGQLMYHKAKRGLGEALVLAKSVRDGRLAVSRAELARQRKSGSHLQIAQAEWEVAHWERVYDWLPRWEAKL